MATYYYAELIPIEQPVESDSGDVRLSNTKVIVFVNPETGKEYCFVVRDN